MSNKLGIEKLNFLKRQSLTAVKVSEVRTENARWKGMMETIWEFMTVMKDLLSRIILRVRLLYFSAPAKTIDLLYLHCLQYLILIFSF